MAQGHGAPSAEAVAAMKEEVALGNRLLHHYGLTTYLGHVSARIPGTDQVIIKARPHVSMDRVRAEDLMIIDLEGNVIEVGEEFTTRVSEWCLHTEIYKRRPEVGSVIHTHQKWCTIFGIAGKPVLPVIHAPDAALAAEPWPVYDESFAIVTEVQQAKLVAEALGHHVACHLRTHGMVFVGRSVERAVMAAAHAEYQAEVTWHGMLAGGPETIPTIFMRDAIDQRYSGQAGAWDRREGAARRDWADQAWVDEHPDAVRDRGIQF